MKIQKEMEQGKRINRNSISCISILLILSVGLLLASCSQPDATGSISLFLDNSKSIGPGSSAVVNSIRFSGTKGDGTVLQPQILSLGDGAKVEGITVGTWTFFVEGLNSEGTTITEVATQGNVSIESGKQTQVSFALRYLSTGDGNFNLTVNWPAGLPTFERVEATVGTETVAGTVTNNSAVMTGTKQVGDYSIEVTFTNKSGTAITFPYLEMANIFKGLESKGTIELEGADFPQAVEPVVTVTDMTGGKQVSLSTTTEDSVIYYTIDGTDPAASSTKEIYTSAIDLTSAGTKTIKAIASKQGLIDSTVASTSVTVEQVAIPTFSPSSATFTDTQEVTITGTTGSTIYYTTDGTTIPTTSSSSLISGGSINVSETITVKAMAVKEGMANSSTAEGVYTKKPVYAVGETGPAGGLIFYVNPNAAKDGWTYLEAASEDESGTYVWGGNGTVTNATATAIGMGKFNTAAIVGAYGDVRPYAGKPYAAKVCDDKTVTNNGETYADWFLPSKDELYWMYTNLYAKGLGSLVSSFYWSSSGVDAYNTWYQNFNGGSQYYGKSNADYVRAVRSF
ncbi:chitobiase/beta-hexosaminidase C-terminal domain-containing protein [uncultured Sphaerochaeta sp.]|uniref:chitobiase/beta-hexosaminidase C-terminal domain-containing protein n=1 Tax=uncultured Sphaerochaeta sp. TaxID=886478 RepID=UPI002A0A57CF|nr:chitobiase/beta-hexosaminidase C-terminal domain-containing protein [uncultured Sphaerochaeta sp.]